MLHALANPFIHIIFNFRQQSHLCPLPNGASSSQSPTCPTNIFGPPLSYSQYPQLQPYFE